MILQLKLCAFSQTDCFAAGLVKDNFSNLADFNFPKH